MAINDVYAMQKHITQCLSRAGNDNVAHCVTTTTPPPPQSPPAPLLDKNDVIAVCCLFGLPWQPRLVCLCLVGLKKTKTAQNQ